MTITDRASLFLALAGAVAIRRPIQPVALLLLLPAELNLLLPLPAAKAESGEKHGGQGGQVIESGTL